MISGIITTFVVTSLVHSVLSGVCGLGIARRRSLPAWLGVVPGCLLPWAGLVVPALARKRSGERLTGMPASSGLPLVGIGAVVVGTLLVMTSVTQEWVTVGGSVKTPEIQGRINSMDLSERLTFALGENPTGVAVIAVIVIATLALAFGSWHRGGLRFALPGMFVGAMLASLLVWGVMAGEALAGQTHLAAKFSGGQANAEFVVGNGTYMAAFGAVLLIIGWFAVVLAKPDVLVQRARVGAHATPAAHIDGRAMAKTLGSSQAAPLPDPLAPAEVLLPRTPAVGGWPHADSATSPLPTWPPTFPAAPSPRPEGGSEPGSLRTPDGW